MFWISAGMEKHVEKMTQMSLRFTVFNSMHLPVSELDAAAVFQVGILDCRLVLGPFSLALQLGNAQQ